jgi:hypothetical protein
VSWPFVLLAAAALVSTAGALAVRVGRGDEPAESRARRSIVGLGLLGVAAALAAVGGALLGAGDAGRTQAGAFAGAAATVVLPLLAVGLARAAHRPGRSRTSGVSPASR